LFARVDDTLADNGTADVSRNSVSFDQNQRDRLRQGPRFPAKWQLAAAFRSRI
jgi:hypothetical protein